MAINGSTGTITSVSLPAYLGTRAAAPATASSTSPGSAPTSAGQAPVDPFGGLEGEDRDAYVAITNTLKAYGLESLAGTVLGFIQQGYSEDTIGLLLQNTDAYKRRFAANESRRQAGLPVLSPAEYLATETAYRQVMSSAGLPVGFYDQPSDFTKWLSDDVSPVEVQQRVKVATEMVNSVDPSTRAAFSQWYSQGDMVAYALDRDRATAVLERQWKAAEVGGAASAQGVGITQETAERLAGMGVGADQARQGFGAVSALTTNASKLSEIYGGDYTANDAVNEVFASDEQAARKRRGLASQERAQFGGTSAVTTGSLSRRSAGQV